MLATWYRRPSFTYWIGYGSDYVGKPSFAADVQASKPGLLHVGHDVPLNSALGNTVQFTPSSIRRISAGEIPARIEELRAFADQMRRSGAGRVIPYLITMLFIGNHETRTGFWEFYDRWDEYSDLGLGPKPDTDPSDWVQCERRPFTPVEGFYGYETTISHPTVQRFLKTCAALVAKCGYDGVFLDVNTMIGETPHDNAWFASYLKIIYHEAELHRLFGFQTFAETRIGKPGEGLLWVETQRFRSWAFGQLFTLLTEAGRAHVSTFFVLPNNSPMCTIDGYYSRRFVGHGLAQIGDGCEMFMYEEMQQAGRFGMDRICDNILQYKTALAYQLVPVVLLYHAQDPNGIALATAEAAAGGGAFVQPGFFDRKTMRFWSDWYERHVERNDGFESIHNVGVVFLEDETYWDNRSHVDAVFRLRQSLSDNHYLFDFIVDPNLPDNALISFRHLIIPEVHHLSAKAVDHLLTFVRTGGRIIIVGTCGDFDERGNAREKTLREVLVGHESSVFWVDSLDALVPRRAPELFDLTEDQYNDIEHVMALPGRVASSEEAQAARAVPLVSALELLARRDLRVLAPDAPYSLRVCAYRDPFENRTIVHLVNYNLPVLGKGKSGEPLPAEDIRVRIASRRAIWWTPEGIDGETLRIEGNEVIVPQVRLYAMLELRK